MNINTPPNRPNLSPLIRANTAHAADDCTTFATYPTQKGARINHRAPSAPTRNRLLPRRRGRRRRSGISLTGRVGPFTGNEKTNVLTGVGLAPDLPVLRNSSHSKNVRSPSLIHRSIGRVIPWHSGNQHVDDLRPVANRVAQRLDGPVLRGDTSFRVLRLDRKNLPWYSLRSTYPVKAGACHRHRQVPTAKNHMTDRPNMTRPAVKTTAGLMSLDVTPNASAGGSYCAGGCCGGYGYAPGAPGCC